MRSSLEPHQRRILGADSRAPQASIGRVDRIRVTSEVDPVVFRGIDLLIRLSPVGYLAVPIGVQYGGTPSLRGSCVVGFVELLRVQPADRIVLAVDERVI